MNYCAKGLTLIILDSGFVLAGGILGSLTYALIRDKLPINDTNLFLHSDILGLPYLQVAVPLFGGLLVSLVAYEKFFNKGQKSSGSKWRPYIGGAIIGLLQIPALYFLGCGLGTSSAFLTIPASCLKLIGYSNPTIEKFTSFPKNYWQVALDVGIVFGSWLYSKLTDEQKPARTQSNIPKSLFGGFILLLGARLAGGCTSGHGLTGINNLSITSMVAVASMFASGIGFATLTNLGK